MDVLVATISVSAPHVPPTRFALVRISYFSPSTVGPQWMTTLVPPWGVVVVPIGCPLTRIPLVKTTARMVPLTTLPLAFGTPRNQDTAFKFGNAAFVRKTICSKFVPGFALFVKYGAESGRLPFCNVKSPLPFKLYNSNNTEA